MTCPRCGNEWDVSKSPCSRCGLLVHLPGRLAATRNIASTAQQQVAQTPPPTPSNVVSGTPQPGGGSPFLPAMPRSPQTDMLGAGSINQSIPKSVPPRFRTVSEPLTDAPRAQSALRPRRLVTERNTFSEAPSSSSVISGGNPANFDLSSMSSRNVMGEAPTFASMRPLAPGTVLRNGRYRLQEQQGRQEWAGGASEIWWLAQDAQRSTQAVAICEVVIPDGQSMLMQSALRTATMVLTSVGRHPSIPTLWDVFSDQGRNFFVFELVEGDSLLGRMRRTGRALSEADVRACCLQMAELLELLSQQSPPLVHGLIRPEHIVIARADGRYVLTHFSVLLASGSIQFIAGMERMQSSPYTAPEFTRGIVDVRSDLYSLLATAYHAVTGSLPSAVGGTIPSAQQLNPTISAQFERILARGLRSNVAQRYQYPSELRQELLAVNSVHGSVAPAATTPYNGPSMQAQSLISAQPEAGNVDVLLPMMASLAGDFEEQDRKSLLPDPEALPPMAERNDLVIAGMWLAGILVVLVVLVILSRGIA